MSSKQFLYGLSQGISHSLTSMNRMFFLLAVPATMDATGTALNAGIRAAQEGISGSSDSSHLHLGFILTSIFLVLFFIIRYLRKQRDLVSRMTAALADITGNTTSPPKPHGFWRFKAQLTDYNEIITAAGNELHSLRYAAGIHGHIFDSISDAIVSSDHEGNIIEFNRAAEEIFGYSREDVIGKPLTMIMPERYRSLHNTGFGRFCETGSPRLSSWDKLELIGLSREGREIPLEANFSVAEIAGKRVITAILTDVTHRKQTEEQLHKLSRAVEQSASMVMITDTSARIEYVNPKFTETTGYSLVELMGKQASLLKSGQTPPETYKDLWATLHAGKQWQGLFINKKKNGEHYWEKAAISPIKNSLGITTHYVAVKEDITERKRFEETLQKAKEAAEAANRAKSEFLANMSHEIRTPMNGIIGMNQLLLETQLNEEQREYSHAIQKSAEALLELINDILDFSKIEAGKLKIEYVDCSLEEIIEGVTEVIAPKAHAKGLELLIDIDPQSPAFVKADPVRLRQILLNLASNAVKFTEEGEILISLRPHPEKTGKASEFYLYFAVKDTGIGIAKDKQALIFESFAQADGSTTRKYGGTGLGLAICKKLVQLMGGEIGLESEPGQGATFWFTIKAKKSKKTAQARVVSHTDVKLLHDKHILVVDDNTTNRLLLERLFRNHGCSVDSVESGELAVQTLREYQQNGKQVDFILLDMMMPGMDGRDTALKIKEEQLAGSAVIIIASSMDNRLSRKEMNRLDIHHFMTKPIKIARLMEILLQSISSSSQAQPQPVRVVSRKETRQLDLPKLHILVAEDNKVNQIFARKILEKHGITVEIAHNGLEVIEALERGENYDLILMDVQMPILDGLSATRRIREQESRTGGHIPIIALTANAMQGDRERCLDSGMDAYISKPIDKDELFKAIWKLFAEQETVGEKA